MLFSICLLAVSLTLKASLFYSRFTEMTNKRRAKASESPGHASRSPSTEASPRVRKETLEREVSITDIVKW